MRITAALSLAVALGAIQTQALSPDDIELAIEKGTGGKELKASCHAMGPNSA